MHILVRDERKAGEVYKKAKSLNEDDFKELAEKSGRSFGQEQPGRPGILWSRRDGA